MKLRQMFERSLYNHIAAHAIKPTTSRKLRRKRVRQYWRNSADTFKEVNINIALAC